MNAETILQYFRDAAKEHQRREKKKQEDIYYDFVNEGFRRRRRSVSHLRPRK